MLVIVCLQLPEDLGTIVATASEAGKFNLGSTAFDLRQPTVWTVLIATFFTNITTYGTDQTIVQRYLTTATEREARKGVYVNAALTIPATILFFLVGTALWAFYRHYPAELSMSVRDSDAILPWYISTQLPSGVLGLIIAGLFAAAMSTLSSSMNSAATAFVTDIHRKLSPAARDGRALLRTARLSTLVLGLVGVGFALMMASWRSNRCGTNFRRSSHPARRSGGLFLLASPPGAPIRSAPCAALRPASSCRFSSPAAGMSTCCSTPRPDSFRVSSSVIWRASAHPAATATPIR